MQDLSTGKISYSLNILSTYLFVTFDNMPKTNNNRLCCLQMLHSTVVCLNVHLFVASTFSEMCLRLLTVQNLSEVM